MRDAVGTRWSSGHHRAFVHATTLDGRVAQVRVVDPHHALYGQCFPVSGRRSGRGVRLIVIRLLGWPRTRDPRSAAAPASAPDALAAAVPSRLAHISVRTLLPLAITCVLCSPRDMRISREAAGETSIRWRRGTPETLPRLWPQLPRHSVSWRNGSDSSCNACDRGPSA